MLVPILLYTSASAWGTALASSWGERIKQLADIDTSLFAQLDMSANAKK